MTPSKNPSNGLSFGFAYLSFQLSCGVKLYLGSCLKIVKVIKIDIDLEEISKGRFARVWWRSISLSLLKWNLSTRGKITKSALTDYENLTDIVMVVVNKTISSKIAPCIQKLFLLKLRKDLKAHPIIMILLWQINMQIIKVKRLGLRLNPREDKSLILDNPYKGIPRILL